MGAKHTLQITLQCDQVRCVDSNLLQLVVQNNSPVMNYQQVIVRLFAPLGISLKPSRVEIAPLPANSSASKTITLITKRAGRYPLKIEANTFPVPNEGMFPRIIQEIEVLPKPEVSSPLEAASILEEITSLQINPRPSSSSPKSSGTGNDIYARYLAGLEQLKQRIKDIYPQYSDFLPYEQRLKENISLTRRYGNTDTLSAGRSEIIEHLNQLALSILNITFNELCDLGN